MDKIQYPPLTKAQQRQLMDDEAVLHTQNVVLFERVRELEIDLDHCYGVNITPEMVNEHINSLDIFDREEFLAKLQTI